MAQATRQAAATGVRRAGSPSPSNSMKSGSNVTFGVARAAASKGLIAFPKLRHRLRAKPNATPKVAPIRKAARVRVTVAVRCLASTPFWAKRQAADASRVGGGKKKGLVSPAQK